LWKRRSGSSCPPEPAEVAGVEEQEGRCHVLLLGSRIICSAHIDLDLVGYSIPFLLPQL
jgi:hypothetical protein